MSETLSQRVGRYVYTVRTFGSVLMDLLKGRLFGHNPNTKEYWDKKLRRFHRYWRNSHYHRVLEVFPQDTAFSVLDIGCALGDGCELIHTKFPRAEVAGADFSKVGIIKARRKNRDIDYHLMDILSDPIPAMYDYITIIQTLEHFDDPLPIVDKCLQSARDSVIVSVPYKQPPSLSSGEHRFMFDDDTFAEYDSEIVCITDGITASGCRCIVYRIKAKKVAVY